MHARSRLTGLVVAVVFAAGSLGAPRPAAGAVTYASPVPTAPALVSPGDGVSSTANPVFSWQAVAHAIDYEVQAFQSPTMSGSPRCSGQTSTLSLTCDELVPDTWFWRVRAVGHHYEPGPWSVTRLYVKLPRSLAAPSITSPAAGTVFTYPDGLGLLRWSPVPGAFRYQVQTSGDASFKGPEPEPHVGLQATEAMRVPVEAIGATRYMRVRAVDRNTIAVSPWSAPRSFRVDWSAPILTSPEDGATTSTMVLAWSPMPGALRYDVQITDAGDTAFANAVAPPADTPWLTWSGADGSSMRWRVRAISEWTAPGPWSEARVLHLDAGAPEAPAPEPIALPPVTLLGPIDGATGVTPAGDPLDWELVAGTKGYQLMIAPADAAFWTEDPPWPDHSVPLPPVTWNQAYGGTFKWRVRAVGQGETRGPWSEVHTFSPPEPAEIALLAPADGAAIPGETLQFSWGAFAAAPDYTLDWSPSPLFPADETVVNTVSNTDPREVVRGIPSPGTTLYWRVKAGRGAAIAVSPVRSVTLLDTTGPSGRVDIAGGGASTLEPVIRLNTDADDAVGHVTDMQLSADGVAWESRGWRPVDETWSLVQEPYGTTAGPRLVYVRWRDDAGNWSAPHVVGIHYGEVLPPDETGPVTTGPVLRFSPNAVMSRGRLPVRLTWTANDDRGGAHLFEVFRSVDGKPPTTIATGLNDPVLAATLPPGHAYQFGVRGWDWSVNVGQVTTAGARRLTAYQQTSAAVTYRGTWTTRRSTAYWGGSSKSATVQGARATFTFTGRAVAWVARSGPGRGRAAVYVDGTKVAVVDLWAPTNRLGVVAWTGSWASSKTRIVQIRVLGTAGRPAVDVDGFATIR